VRIRLLGSTEVEGCGSDGIPGSRARQLLALLAIRAPEPVPAEQLADELWEGAPPASAGAALRVHVGVLRRSLEPDRVRGEASLVIPRTPAGYALAVGPEQLDLLEFEARVVAGRARSRLGERVAAIEEFEAALALWRGDALLDARTLPAVGAAVAHLTEMRLTAVEELAAAHLAGGNPAAAEGVLVPALVGSPARESLVELLMVARYRLGRPTEALRCLTELARQLDDLGLVPSSSLRSIEEAILLEDPRLDWRAPDAIPVSDDRQVGRLVGRRAELEELRGLVARRDRTVLVQGPAGIGKSSLVAQLVGELRAEGQLVLVGTCSEQGVRDYLPFVDVLVALGDLVPAAFDAPGGSAFRDGWPDSGGDGFDGVPGADDRLRYFAAVSGALDRASQGTTGLVLVLEDVHWIDRASLALLRYLVRDPTTPLQVLATARDDELGSNEDLHDALARVFDSDDRLALTGLDRDAVAAMLGAMAPARVVGDLTAVADTFHRATGGNPLFVAELARDLIEGGETAAVGRAGWTAPSRVTDPICRRLRRLTPGTVQLLEWAAVAGPDLDLAVLGAVTGVTDVRQLDAVDEAMDARLLVPPRPPRVSVGFAHDLVRAAVISTIGPGALPRMHLALARAYQAVAPGRSDVAIPIAWHYREAADQADPTEAAAAMSAAGAVATEQLAFEDARTWFESAIALRGSSDHRAQAADGLLLGRACLAAGHADGARDAFLAAATHARAAGDVGCLADIAVANVGSLAIPHFRDDQRSLVEETLSIVGVEDPVRRVALLNAQAMLTYHSDHAAERRAVAEALQIGERVGGRPYAVALAARHRALAHEPGPAEAREDAARAALDAARASDADDEFCLLRERHWLNEVLVAGRIEELRAGVDAWDLHVREVGSPVGRYHVDAVRATLAIASGDLELGEQLAGGARALGLRTEIPGADGAHMLALFVVRWVQGRLAELPPATQRRAGPDEPVPAGLGLAAVACVEMGYVDLAEPILEQALAPDALPFDGTRLAALALLVGPALALGDVAHLDSLRRAFDEFDDPVVVFGTAGAVIGVTDQWRGVVAAGLGDAAGARMLLERAVALCNDCGFSPWEARARDALRQMERPSDSPHRVD
jgi:DNA-binding SARP family transcriptional activator